MMYQTENADPEIEIIKKNQMEILELKSTITEIKNALERFQSRFKQAEVFQQT